MGRRPIGKRAMTAAERQRRHRHGAPSFRDDEPTKPEAAVTKKPVAKPAVAKLPPSMDIGLFAKDPEEVARRMLRELGFSACADFAEALDMVLDTEGDGLRRPLIGKAIRQRFANGKWHGLDAITKKIDADAEHIRETLDGICKNQTYGCRGEKKRVGTRLEYRLFKLEKLISSPEIAEKLAPVFQGFTEQSRKNMVTVSLPTIAVLTGQLGKLMEEWC